MKVVTTESAWVLAAILLIIGTTSPPVAASRRPKPCARASKYYEEAIFDNAIRPLRVQRVRGKSVRQDLSGHIEPGEIPLHICLSLFSAETHEFVASTTADDHGNFDFGPVEPGRYRLVARAQAMCTGNVPVEVVKSGRKARHRGIVILFRIPAVDVCTSADYAK